MPFTFLQVTKETYGAHIVHAVVSCLHFVKAETFRATLGGSVLCECMIARVNTPL